MPRRKVGERGLNQPRRQLNFCLDVLRECVEYEPSMVPAMKIPALIFDLVFCPAHQHFFRETYFCSQDFKAFFFVKLPDEFENVSPVRPCRIWLWTVYQTVERKIKLLFKRLQGFFLLWRGHSAEGREPKLPQNRPVFHVIRQGRTLAQIIPHWREKFISAFQNLLEGGNLGLWRLVELLLYLLELLKLSCSLGFFFRGFLSWSFDFDATMHCSI